MSPNVDPFTGFIVGMAVGDALGLPREGISPRRARRMYGGAPLRHRFVFGRGMVSDDTEHMRMTAMSLLAEPQNADRFARHLGWRLRWWLVALPAGTGMATARAILRLWLGWSPKNSGVYSAGNGPAMRAGVIGLCLRTPEAPLHDFVRAATRITHVDPRAETGAGLIAIAARSAALQTGQSQDPHAFLQDCRDQIALDAEWQQIFHHIQAALTANETAAEFAHRAGMSSGVGGYIVHTVAAVLFCWLRWPGEFRRPVEEIIQLGGDTDTTAAILGGLAGAACGADAIPREWIDGLIEWPHSVTWMRTVLGSELRNRWGDAPQRVDRSADVSATFAAASTRAAGQFGRNLVFLAIVLLHGFRRLLPPY